MAKILKIVFNIIFVLLIVSLSTYFILRIFGTAEIYKVQTGSMEDGIHAGDYILVYKKNKYNIGNVVTYKREGYHVTHRIIKKNGNKVITKGDANNVEDDEINVKSIVGEVIYNGGILNFLINYKYALASALLALYLFSCYFGKKEKNEDFEEDITLNEKENIDIEEIKKETKNDEIIKEDEETIEIESTLDEEKQKEESLNDEKDLETKEEEVKEEKPVKKKNTKKSNSKKKSQSNTKKKK